jgi:hypothetical protein
VGLTRIRSNRIALFEESTSISRVPPGRRRYRGNRIAYIGLARGLSSSASFSSSVCLDILDLLFVRLPNYSR